MPFNFRRMPPPVRLRKAVIINYRPAAVPKEWKNAEALAEEYIEAMIQASRRLLFYKVVGKVDVPAYPLLLDGRQYDDTTWNRARMDDKSAFRDARGQYVLADYNRILAEYKILPAIQSNQIDEVWLFGGPYFGFYESRMVGKNAFWCNAPAIQQDVRRFVVMGFNYERGSREMIHSFGHRAESIIARHYNSQEFLNKLYGGQPLPEPKNDFEQWLKENGTVHRKPGGGDYGQDEYAWLLALKVGWWKIVIDPNKVN